MSDQLSVAGPSVYDVYTDQQLTAGKPPVNDEALAVVVVHGMGQQSKFDTLNQVADALTETFGAGLTKRTARNVKIGAERLSRMELNIDGIGPEVHVYEAYWAPITEGNVVLRDVMSFLYGGALNGLKCVRQFPPMVFGEYRPLGFRHWRTLFSLSFTLAVILSLVAINTGIAGFEALVATGTKPKWLTSVLVEDLTSVVLMLLFAMVAFGAVLYAAKSQKTACAYSRTSTPFVSKIAFIYMFLTGLAVMLSGIVFAEAVHHHRHGDGGAVFGSLMTWGTIFLILAAAGINALAAVLLLRGAARRTTKLKLLVENVVLVGVLLVLAYAVVNLVAFRASNHHWPKPELTALPSMFARVWIPAVPADSLIFVAVGFVAERWVGIWVALAAISAWIRKFLIQYLGDVAVYVAPKTLDRFNQMREAIKTCVGTVVDTVYRARSNAGDEFLYGRVLVIGHSLGSVAAYDAVNRMVNYDGYVNRNLQANTRTARLITFGSPLNKLAFLFASSSTQRGAEGRAALASTVQPLIADEDTTVIPWTNIHSVLDIISGPVDFYAMPRSRNDQDLPDYEALVPLAAHTEYWDNRLLWSVVTNTIHRAAAEMSQFKVRSVHAAVPPHPAHITIKVTGATATGSSTIDIPQGADKVAVEWQS
jgi:hypothetical protein